jgi:hypothetical protein
MEFEVLREGGVMCRLGERITAPEGTAIAFNKGFQEAAPLHPPLEVLGVERLKGQPSDSYCQKKWFWR